MDVLPFPAPKIILHYWFKRKKHHPFSLGLSLILQFVYKAASEILFLQGAKMLTDHCEFKGCVMEIHWGELLFLISGIIAGNPSEG